MKILYIIDTLKRGGKEKQLVELLKYLHLDHKIEIIVFDNIIEYEVIFSLNIRVHYFASNKKSWRYLFFLFKRISELKPDIVHTWELVSSIMTGFVLKFSKAKHINGCLRGSAPIKKFSWRSFLYNISFLLSDKVVSNSIAGLKAKNREKGTKFKVIYNGCNYDKSPNNLERKATKSKFGVNSKYVVGMVSTFRNGKDYLTFIKVAKRVISERDDVSFIAVGDGIGFNKIQKLIVEDEKKKIILTGKRFDVDKIISIFNIGVLLSYITPDHGEGISNSIMEYMSHSLPVIATNVGGNPEIVEHMNNGLLIQPKNEDDFYKAILTLLSNPETAKRLGKNGFHLLKMRLTNELMVNNFLNLYKEEIS